MRRYYKKLISLIFAAVLLASAAVPACFAENAVSKNISIRSEADLRAFQQKCRLDTWSRDVIVSLESDVVLEDRFTPIPYFSGTFEGNGHTIRGLVIDCRTENAGLFGIVDESAVIRNLNVSGSILPKGSVFYTGGIAAQNRGYIDSCTFTGSVLSDTVSGGIAGLNEGIIIHSSNSAGVDANISKSVKLKIGTVIDAVKKNGLHSIVEIITKGAIDVSDDCSGGICGYNKGSLVSCSNQGRVGTKTGRANYYTGGIAGRNDGCIYLCSNAGSVSGDFFVGGIAGISTPYFKSVSSGNLFGNTRNDIDRMIDIIDSVTYSLDDGVTGMTASISGIAGSLGSAVTYVSQLETEVAAFANGKIDEVNQITDYANTAVTGISGITGEISAVGDDVNDIADNVNLGIDELKNRRVNEALKYFGQAVNGIPVMIGDVNNITTELDNTLQMMNEKGLPEFSEIGPGVDYATAGLTDSLRAATDQIKALSGSLNSFEKSLTEDIRSVTALAQDLSDRVFEIIYSLDDLSIDYFLNNKSGEVPASESPMPGVISCCVNTGSVNGGKDTGGIAGALDFFGIPEIDNTETSEKATEEGFSIKSLQYFDLISDCRNYGNITGSKDYTGGIAGYIGVGAVAECGAYGSVYSDGMYAGGISGGGRGLIKDNFIRSRISGKDYVGGVIGCGEEKNAVFAASEVSRNFVDVSVASDDVHFGAIGGDDKGGFFYNYFTIGSLNGIGDYSLEFSAAPVKMAQILALDNCPDEFTWSREKLDAAAVQETKSASLFTDMHNIELIVVMAVLAVAIAVLLRLLLRKPAEKIPYNNKQPWKD